MKIQITILLIISVLLSCSSDKELELPLVDNLALERSLLKVEVLAKDLDVPWDLEYADDGYLWFNEQIGTISRINLQTGEIQKLLTIDEVWKKRTAGLLGLAVHPDFENNPFVLVNYTVMVDSIISNKLVKYTFQNDALVSPQVLLEIPGNTAHNGSRIKFSHDRKILWATGDAYGFDNAQSDESLNGKVLRINLDGSIPKDNPDPKSYVWAKGFRNIQGLTLDDKGNIFTSEHGDAIEDEINLIQKGGNYGWPHIEGFHDLDAEKQFAKINNSLEPVYSWTPVVAPAGLDFYGDLAIDEWKNSLLLTTLKGKSLRVLKLSEDRRSIIDETVFFDNHYGRLRDVAVAPSGEIYVATSNNDWNPQPGFPLQGDDKILKISLTKSTAKDPLKGEKPKAELGLDGKQLYSSYCASCHKEDGTGVQDIFPSLISSEAVMGNKEPLIQIMLKGIENKENGQMMPSFSFMKDEELAAILTFIRQEWGNSAPPISANTITENR
ncbi:PQQ-dependent sugar dehydrogenase [Belliella kenyensis]|uniref:PQQ-dependent sugar dehydrogenase n=1 Tax=Belliella kenyensis TaxID=1472724 RepID=A0ABV8EMJ2_9BACT|nr:PQQ-dependent sugar dehydrogenase [Belliella kenyensis]MCH7400715.1 PQQ-dependent sugar dehydrogenase [Belliella kenyensis]MDN3601998.1 PQQ-dependent sugar dehydrogenase [Belliella kenyensis]